MAERNKEKPVPTLCLCGAAPIWSKAKPGFFFACPCCLIRGGWRKSLDQATESWNTEVLKTRYESRDKNG